MNEENIYKVKGGLELNQKENIKGFRKQNQTKFSYSFPSATLPRKEINPNEFSEQGISSILHSDKVLCYDESKKENVMSLVGIMKNKNGIVAFGEEQSIYQVGGQNYPKGKVKKVFSGGNFLFVSYGNNEVFLPNEIIPLEEVIQKMRPEKFDCYFTFFEKLHSYLRRKKALDTMEYHFILGTPYEFDYNSKHYQQYLLMDCLLNHTGVDYYSRTHENILIAGCEEFLPRTVFVQEFWTLDKMEQYAKMLVEDSVKYAQLIYGENSPIGGKANITSISCF